MRVTIRSGIAIAFTISSVACGSSDSSGTNQGAPTVDGGLGGQNGTGGTSSGGSGGSVGGSGNGSGGAPAGGSGGTSQGGASSGGTSQGGSGTVPDGGDILDSGAVADGADIDASTGTGGAGTGGSGGAGTGGAGTGGRGTGGSGTGGAASGDASGVDAGDACAQLRDCCASAPLPFRASCRQLANGGMVAQCSAVLGLYCQATQDAGSSVDAGGGCNALATCCPSLGIREAQCQQIVTANNAGACDLFANFFCP